ncbi:flavin-containing monooxygenase [Pimelobacter simplex]|uniref:flavin-containing monooxygenase n=1 Tax=Nocardioides simplex TaxID=2045 RepID=UPI00214FAEDE|nr:NAD(P)/FAD-dependent oxidoreductase [Pimelobacter simplex]UUW90094.1 NAD(P)/FAD-dependent oxidoreductase [Pimelobacter simplex]UUW93923.1 NAD(P)/FAD-dependent oxidoreductase [Pimelobacter simplex]
MNAPNDTPVRDLLVVGAGLAGIYAMYRALEQGLDVVGVEAGDSVGGTWYWNRYPGARCDVESVDYSYSFDRELEKDWRWTERFATQPEIRAYLDHVADRYDLRRHFTFGRRVSAARFDEQASTWTATLDDGTEHRARFVMMATGCLSAPHRPDLPGIDDFAGTQLFTAQWPEEPVDLTGKRVGLIGTGSSGIQAAPLLAEQAQSLTVFQRSANYTVPARNRPLTEDEQREIQETYPERREASRYAPAGSLSTTHAQKATEVSPEERERAFEARWQEGGVLFAKTFPDQSSDLVANDYAREFAEAKIRGIVADPQVATDLIPTDHPIGTKRIVTDTGYYEMYNRDDVELVNLRRDPIEQVTAWGIKTADASFELDVLVFATGFDALTGALTSIDLRGARGAVLADEWAAGPTTYLGLGVAGFPNLITLNGPGSPSVLANMSTHTEQQVDWGMDLIAYCREHGIDQAEPRRDAAEKWTDHLGEVAEGTLFVKAASWYMGANIEGKKRTFMPYIGGFGNYRRLCDEARDTGYAGYVLTTRS